MAALPICCRCEGIHSFRWLKQKFKPCSLRLTPSPVPITTSTHSLLRGPSLLIENHTCTGRSNKVTGEPRAKSSGRKDRKKNTHTSGSDDTRSSHRLSIAFRCHLSAWSHLPHQGGEPAPPGDSPKSLGATAALPPGLGFCPGGRGWQPGSQHASQRAAR